MVLPAGRRRLEYQIGMRAPAVTAWGLAEHALARARAQDGHRWREECS